MKIFSVILSAISILMLLSTLICGLWLQAKGADSQGIAFHVKLAIPTVVICLISLALLIFNGLKNN